MANSKVSKVFGITEFCKFDCNGYEADCESRDCTKCECYQDEPDFERIANEVEQAIQEQGYDVNVRYHRVWKNNVELNGFEFRRSNSNIAPTLYWRDDTTIQDLVEAAKQALDKGCDDFDAVNVFTRDFVTNNVYPRVYEANTENLLNLSKSHIGFEFIECSMNKVGIGLIYTLYVVLDNFDTKGTATVQVNKSILDLIGLSWNELKEYALFNIKSNVYFKSMHQTMMEILSAPWEEMELGCNYPTTDMWVLSTTNKLYGAGTLCNEQILEMVCEKLNIGSFAIIPSSIHELLIIPEGLNVTSSELIQIVKDVNATGVKPEDRLCDGLFGFNIDYGFHRIEE